MRATAPDDGTIRSRGILLALAALVVVAAVVLKHGSITSSWTEGNFRQVQDDIN